MGFEDIYLSSPGSLSEKYGKDYFICTGPASILVPVTVNPGEEWRGAQVIEHDNLTWLACSKIQWEVRNRV